MKRAKGQKVSAKDVIAACEGTGGIITLIAKKCNCTRQTIASLRDKNKDVAAAIDEAKEEMLDLSESVLFQKISKYKDLKAVMYYLDSKGRDRGYGKTTQNITQKTELTVNNLDAIPDDAADKLLRERGRE